MTYPLNYLAVFIIFIFSILFTVGTLILSYFLRPHRPDAVKLSPYECGMEPIGDAREKQAIRFYMVAMLFVLFDIETAFLFPWAVIYKQIGLFGFLEMLIFILILVVGYIYVWKKGALKWI